MRHTFGGNTRVERPLRQGSLLLLTLLAACSAVPAGTERPGSASRAAAHACPQIAGAETLWKEPGIRWIVVGETHGTAEIPAAFGDLVCLASAARGPVTVGIEHPASAQAAIDAFMSSRGSSQDRQALLASDPWKWSMKDGRTSVAFLQLIERLRGMKRNGAVARVVAFQSTRANGAAGREADMARTLVASSAGPGSLVLALVGNIHARKTEVTFGGSSYLPAAAHLPDEATLSIDARGKGGSAWVCIDECGPRALGASSSETTRRIVLGPAFAPLFDGVLHLGTGTTASPPATPGP